MTPRNAFTELVTAQHLGFWFLVTAALIAAGLGAFHALEPGHGKTIVAAYLVGSHGTAMHAFLLGLIVTFAHTAGVYLLGLVTLYASRYVVPDRLYPWLGVVSGATIVVMGIYLLFRRRTGHAHGHSHHHGHSLAGHSHFHAHAHGHEHSHAHGHSHVHVHPGSQGDLGPGFATQVSEGLEEYRHAHTHPNVRSQIQDSRSESPNPESRTLNLESRSLNPEAWTPNPERVSYRELMALGVSGGIVPCPAALVVLLSAVTLHRVALGLFLIAAFSVGLAAVLIVIGLMMVCAGRFMSQIKGEGPLMTHWLPLTSAAFITILGMTITIRALVTAGVLQIRI
jgi:ABC-type nickel/cobalt efflux system permease component RcnA